MKLKIESYNMAKLKILIISFFILSGFFCFSQTSHAADYYVSPSGSASWNQCTNINTPCSVYTAFSNATAGDTIYFRGGTYNIKGTTSWYQPDLAPSNSGTPSSPIIFQGYPGETAIFVGDNANSPVFGTSVGNYHDIIFKNFTVDTSAASASNIRCAFKLNGGSNITIENIIAIGHYLPITDHHAVIETSDGGPFTIRNCKIYNGTGNDTSGISSWNNTNLIVENNEIYNCYRGIDSVEVNTNNIYRYNYIHNVTELGMRIYYQNGGSSGVKIYQNIIEGGIYFNGGDGPLPNNLVYNNTLYKGNIGFVGAPYLEIFNNIIWHEVTSGDNEADSFIVYLSSTDPGIINYNLYWGRPLLFGYRIYGGGSWYYSMPWGPQGYDANSKNQNPSFVNAGSGLATGFKLNAGSPALTGGRGGSYATVMGAYITGNETIGLIPSPDTTPPAAPRNLIIL